jgi:protein gp37
MAIQAVLDRTNNMARMLPSDWGNGWPQVRLGVTAEDQVHFNRRWPILAATPARLRFISYEPALGPLVLDDIRPDWIVCGGESGPGARYMEPAWSRALRDESAAVGVAFFMKQMSGKASIPDDLMVRQYPVRNSKASAA